MVYNYNKVNNQITNMRDTEIKLLKKSKNRKVFKKPRGLLISQAM